MAAANQAVAKREPLENREAAEIALSDPENETTAGESPGGTEPQTQENIQPVQAETQGAAESGVESGKAETAGPRRRREPRAPVSQAVVRMQLRLRSRHAQRVQRRSYDTAQRALYTLSVMLRVYASEPEAEQVGAVVDQMLEAVRNDLAEETARMEKVAETQGVDFDAIEYTQPEAFHVEISTPKAGKYLGLVGEFDRFISLMDLLWLSGVYTDAQYNAGSYQWQRRLVKLANRLRNLAQRAMALSRREDAPAGSLAELLRGDDEKDGDEDAGTDEDETKAAG